MPKKAVTKPKVYKKRGRKPKGGKIIAKKKNTITQEVVDTPNIILHLKCFSRELTDKYSNEYTSFDPLSSCSLLHWKKKEIIISYTLKNIEKKMNLFKIFTFKELEKKIPILLFFMNVIQHCKVDVDKFLAIYEIFIKRVKKKKINLDEIKNKVYHPLNQLYISNFTPTKYINWIFS